MRIALLLAATLPLLVSAQEFTTGPGYSVAPLLAGDRPVSEVVNGVRKTTAVSGLRSMLYVPCDPWSGPSFVSGTTGNVYAPFFPDYKPNLVTLCVDKPTPIAVEPMTDPQP